MRKLILIGLTALVWPLDASGEQDMVEWMNSTFVEPSKAVAEAQARLGRKADSNQVESSAATGNSSSLLDRSSATDFLGLALNLADLSGLGAGDEEKNSGSVTTSLYAFKTLLTGADPMDPEEYCRSGAWRRATLDLGFEGDEEDSSDSAVTVGAKFVFWNKRDPCLDDYDADFARLTTLLQAATTEFSNKQAENQDFLFERLRGGGDFAAKNAFLNEIGNAPDFETWMRAQPGGAEALEELRTKTLRDGERAIGMVALRTATSEIFQKIRGSAQSSVSFVTKQSEDGADDYGLNLLLDCSTQCRFGDRLNFSLNGGVKYIDGSGSNSWGGSAALEMQVRLNPRPNFLEGENYVLALGARADWAGKRRDVYKVQAQMSLPIIDGFELPLSLSWSNGTAGSSKDDVRAQINFTVDTSRIVEYFTGNANLGVLARLAGR